MTPYLSLALTSEEEGVEDGASLGPDRPFHSELAGEVRALSFCKGERFASGGRLQCAPIDLAECPALGLSDDATDEFFGGCVVKEA